MTEIVNYSTGELAEAPSYGQVRESIETTKSHLERAAEQVVWQIESQSWLVLGYASWDEMREAEYKGAAVIVPAADRPELSQRLRASGMTHQEIADTIGVSDRTVAKDVNRNPSVEPPAITNARGQSRPTSYTPKTSTSVAPEAQARETSASSKADVEAAPMVGADGLRGGEGRSDASVIDGVAADNSDDSRPADSDVLGDYIDGSQAVQDARYLANFYKAITKASDYRVFDAERIGRIGNDEDMRTLELQAQLASEFYEKAKRSRSGLRVIAGGKR